MGSFKQKKSEDEELFKLLRPGRNTYLKISQVANELGEKFVLLLVETKGGHANLRVELLRYFNDIKCGGVYVTLNTPLENLIETLKKNEVDLSEVLFIDGITKITDATELSGKNYKYIESPRDLVELGFLIDKEMDKPNHEKKFIIIDSVSTLMIYNSQQAIKQFVHSITGKMKAWKIRGILIANNDEGNDAINYMAQFCDKTSEVD